MYVNIADWNNKTIKTMYYNTTNERGAQLTDSRLKAASQNEVIFAYFKYHKRSLFNPSAVWRNCFNEDIPLTSVRRAITTLEHEGKLKKTDIKTPGIYGKDTHTWTLA